MSSASLRRTELTRRVAVLTVILVVLVFALAGFWARQSLVTTARPYLVTRVWLPAIRLHARPANPTTATAQGIPVLVYHGIQPVGSSCNVTPETFIAHMKALSDAGYTTITMQDFLAHVRGSRALPDRSILITFDDGRTDSFSGADPVLRSLGFHASMFTILGRTHSAKSFYLTAAETKMMARTGRWDIQSHTTSSHQFVASNQLGGTGRALATRRWDTALQRLESDAEYVGRVRGDLLEAKARLSGLSGRPVVALAYPWGDFGHDSGDPLIRDTLPRIAQEIYPVTFTQAGATVDETYNYSTDLGRVTFRRIYITHDLNAEELIRRLERGRPKPLPFADEGSFTSGGWALSAGILRPVASGQRALVPSAVEGSTRAEAFLDGSRWWQDYTLAAGISLEETETVTLIARRSGPRDYIAATISRTYCSVQQVHEDRVATLGQADIWLMAGARVAVKLSVTGSRAALCVDGRQTVAVDGIDPSLATGGVAIRIEAPSTRTLTLDGLSVQPTPTRVSALPPAEPDSAAVLASGGTDD